MLLRGRIKLTDEGDDAISKQVHYDLNLATDLSCRTSMLHEAIKAKVYPPQIGRIQGVFLALHGRALHICASRRRTERQPRLLLDEADRVPACLRFHQSLLSETGVDFSEACGGTW